MQFLHVLRQHVLKCEGKGLGNSAGAFHRNVYARAQHPDRRNQDDGPPAGRENRCVRQGTRAGREHAGEFRREMVCHLRR